MKEYKGLAGVYTITHIPTGHYYIGSTNDIFRRWKAHLMGLLKGTHFNYKLQHIFTTTDDIRFEPVVLGSQAEALEMEQKLLNEHWGKQLCCNIRDSAEAAWLVMPQWLKDRMSDARKRSDKWREAVKKSHIGNTWRVGQKQTEETKRNISKAKKGRPNGLLGKKATLDHRRNLKDAQNKMKDRPGYYEMKGRVGLAKSVPVSINGVVYPNTRMASEALGLDYGCVDYRLRSTSKRFKDWFLIRGK